MAVEIIILSFSTPFRKDSKYHQQHLVSRPIHALVIKKWDWNGNDRELKYFKEIVPCVNKHILQFEMGLEPRQLWKMFSWLKFDETKNWKISMFSLYTYFPKMILKTLRNSPSGQICNFYLDIFLGKPLLNTLGLLVFCGEFECSRRMWINCDNQWEIWRLGLDMLIMSVKCEVMHLMLYWHVFL